MAHTDASGDNDDLQALFDSVASQAQPPVSAPAAAPAPAKESASSGDSDDLQALFDSIVSAQSEDIIETTAAPQPVAEADASTLAAEGGSCDTMFEQIGHMTRKLYNTMRELGYDKKLEDAVQAIPDARDRLAYITTMTEQAAERAINATEAARPLQDKLETGATALSASWQKVFDQQMDMEEFKSLVVETRKFLAEVPQHTRATNAQLTEIMMAQDFQDLTGQVIKRVVDMAQSLEQQLLQLLLTATPPERRPDNADGLLNGPVINAEGRSDVVTSQEQVDELLESLGF